MIDSPSPSMPQQPPNSPSSFSDSSPIQASALPPQPPSKGDNKRVLLIVFILLFIAAVGGGLFAYQSLNKTKTEELTQVQPTLAWRPTVTGTCVEGKISREKESVPFLINLDMKLNGTETAPTQSFLSQGPDNSINKTFNWDFTSTVKKGDKITWNAVVKYTQNGNLHEEKYSGTIDIVDTCGTGSPSPTPTSSPTASPSHSPSGTPRYTPTPTPTRSATASPTASPTGTPPVGGPSNTPTPTATPTPTNTPAPSSSSTSSPAPASSSTPVAQSSSTPTPDRAVADATALPQAGVNDGIMYAIIGGVSLFVSALLALMKKKYY